MNTKKLIEKFLRHEISGLELQKIIRKRLTNKGMIKTKLLGWIHKKELQRLLDNGAICPYYDDYAIKSELVDEEITNKRGTSHFTGRKISVPTKAALKLFCNDPQETAIQKTVENVSEIENFFDKM